MTKKILKLDREVSLSVYDLEGNIEDAIKHLSSFRAAEGLASDLEAKIVIIDGYDGAVELSVCYYRLETDEELAKRKAAEATAKAKAKAEANAIKLKKEEKERAEYLRLKAKFG